MDRASKDRFAAHRLPRGRHGLAREEVAESQRWRLLVSAGEVLGADGYRAATARRICARAGVSSTTFYEHYGNLDACLLAAHEVALDCFWELVCAAKAKGEGGDRVRTALDAASGFTLSEPGLSRLLCADVAVAVPAAAVARERELGRLQGFEAVLAGGVLALFGDRVAAGDQESIPALADELSDLLGNPRFLEQISEPIQKPRKG